ncbi:hypothetical protein GYMLUDRAFT_248372, partial [Collybiopsis luxurians FD-317 M1]
IGAVTPLLAVSTPFAPAVKAVVRSETGSRGLSLFTRPTGAILATANIEVDPTSDNALPNEKCPNITIHSASAATHEEDEYCLFFDDKEYGTILEGKWVSIPPEQRKRTIEF